MAIVCANTDCPHRDGDSRTLIRPVDCRRRTSGVSDERGMVANELEMEVRPVSVWIDGCVFENAHQTSVRWRVEEFFEDAKGELGITQFEACSWRRWHHHMSLVALAHLFITQTRRDLRRKNPELTLDMALLLLRTVLPRPELSLEDAEELVEYHQARNRQATESHRKRWLAEHLKLIPRK